MASQDDAKIERKFDSDIPTSNRLINQEQRRKIFPGSNMTVWRMERRGDLPMHVSIGGRNYWWLEPFLTAIERLADSDAEIAEDRPQSSPISSGHQTKSTPISVQEASERANEGPATIIGWCVQHKIGQHVKTGSGGDWMVDPVRLERFLAERDAAS